MNTNKFIIPLQFSDLINTSRFLSVCVLCVYMRADERCARIELNRYDFELVSAHKFFNRACNHYV